MDEDYPVSENDKYVPRLARRRLGISLGAALMLALAARATSAQSPGAGPISTVPALTIGEALRAALSGDPGLRGAELERRSAEAEAEGASRKRLPSLSASLGYTRLSELPAADYSLPNDYSFELDLSYPVYDGGKRELDFAMAKLQAGLKGIEGEEARRSLAFELRRRYWEASRAENEVSIYGQDFELADRSLELIERQFAQGVAAEADRLAARTRREKASDELDEARTELARARLRLASLMGVEPGSLPPELATKPSAEAAPDWPESPDAVALVSEALARRPETREALVGLELAKNQAELSRVALRPALTASGSYVYADPNARIQTQTDPSKFTGTWSLGLALSFDLGGLPAALCERKARVLASERVGADEEAQRRAVALDVETSVLNLQRSRRALASAEVAAGRAAEDFRIAQGRLAAGTIKDLELDAVQSELLKARLEAEDRLIENLMAREDLARALALEGRE
jgi:outer membrane protein TolC